MKTKGKIMSLMLASAMIMSLGVTAFATELTGDNLMDTEKLDTAAGTYDGNKYNEFEGDGTTDGKASSVVVVDAEATTFKATVPIALRGSQAADGTLTFADDMQAGSTGTAKIINGNALGQVKIVSVKLTPVAGTTISPFDSKFEDMKVNSKTFGFKINGVEVGADGIITNTAATDTITSTVKNVDDGKTDTTRVYDDYTFTRSGDSAFPVITNGSVLPITYEIKLPAYSQAVDNVPYASVVFTVDFN